MWAGHATGNVKPGVGVTYKFILTQREGAPPSSPSSPPPPPAPSPPPPVPSPPPSPGLPPGVSAPPLGDTHVSFFFFCVACLACSCLLLPFSVFASFLLRTHQNHLPPCEVCFISVCPYFLFLPFSLLPSVCSLLFCLDSSKPTRLLFLFARSFCSVFPPFCFLRAVSSLRFGRFYSERRPPLSPYIGGRFPHISDSNSSFSCFSLSLHPTFFF